MGEKGQRRIGRAKISARRGRLSTFGFAAPDLSRGSGFASIEFVATQRRF